MPTFVVTRCGVLGDESQDSERASGGGTHRLTAFAIPFMAGKHLYIKLEGQGMMTIVRRACAAINSAGACPGLLPLSLCHVRISDPRWLLQAPLPLLRAV